MIGSPPLNRGGASCLHFSCSTRKSFTEKGNALLALGVVSTIVALIVASMLLTDSYQRDTTARVKNLDDEIRKTMKELGFNIFILPRNLNLGDFFGQDFGKETMNEQLVHKLADAKGVVTINHLRPALIQKVEWPEQSREIILMGVKGVVPWSHRKNPKKPLAEPVDAGSINLGNVLARQVGAKPGATLMLQGKEFKVGKIYPARGNQDDVTAWVDLPAVQEISGMTGRINMIQALNCNCASADALAEIESEISGVLGSDVKVIELQSELIARAKARTKVAQSGEDFVGFLKNASLTGSAILIGLGSLILALMFLKNASERSGEVGMLRAIGVSRNQILGLFLGKSGLVGLAGGVLGCLAGFLVALAICSTMLSALPSPTFDWRLAALSPVAAALVSVLATWVPVEAVTGRDPARILREAS